MLTFDNVIFRYEPYPIAFARSVLPSEVYSALTDSYPALSAMKRRESLGNKYILTEFDGDTYFAILNRHPAWRQFYDHVKSQEFIVGMLDFLARSNIDLGLRGIEIVDSNHFRVPSRRLWKGIVRKAKQVTGGSPTSHMHLTSRFEFGAFPGGGGSQYPHTDAPRKVISLVLSMVKEGEWDPAWGGGTAVVKPKDPTKNFNYVNKYLGFDGVDVLEAFPFVPNGCVVFVKTYNSWHAVMPINAPNDDVIRKTVVVNVDLIGGVAPGPDY